MTDPPLFMNVGSRGRERPVVRTKTVFSRLTDTAVGPPREKEAACAMPERRGRTGPMSTPGACAESPRPCPPGRDPGPGDADAELVFRIRFLPGGCTRKYTQG